MNKQEALEFINEKMEVFTTLSDFIWDNPETSFEEFKASEAICDILQKEGFIIEKNIAGIETAFSGTFGSGKPIIAILGEYDALSSMSQIANAFTHKPIGQNAKGHGCGHNLLGAGALAAAVGVKEYLKENDCSGTVIYFGCPAEEGGSGKAFMAREGVFSNIDIALTWHPGNINAANSISTNANFKINYKFKGVSSHAAASPHLGRSALDALELMCTGVQYLREHIIPQARIHYAIINAGGKSPNVVQSETEIAFYIRAPKLRQVRELHARVEKIASGAALMTETTVGSRFLASCANVIPNDIIAEVMSDNLLSTNLPEYTDEEIEYAQKMYDTILVKDSSIIELVSSLGAKGMALAKMFENKSINNFVVPNLKINHTLASSSDVGDVSWNCPTSQIMVATEASGTPSHSWQRTAQGKSSLAHKGMIYAGQVMAGTAIDFIENSELVIKAKTEFDSRMNGEKYICDIPSDTKPTPMESDE